MYNVIPKLPLSIVMIIATLGPIFIFILNALIYKVAITKNDMIGVLIAFLGATFVLKPDLIIKGAKSHNY